jgi:hypothetical protein
MPANLWDASTPAERAAFEDHQRLARATTIPTQPGAPVRQFATDEERYAFMDASDAAHAQRIRDVRAARAGAAPAPAAMPPPAVARPTPSTPQAPNFAMNAPTIASTLAPTAEATDANILYVPAAGRGASVNTSENTVVVHSPDARSETAQAASHDMAPTMRLEAEGRNIAAAVKAAEQRVADARDPISKATAVAQLQRANEHAAWQMARLQEIAASRAPK